MPTTRTDPALGPCVLGHDQSERIKTSVIIPVYNTEDYLEECLESVLAQTQREIEVILVDDGSTDSSLEIERRYAECDPRVRVITQENQRQGAARNRGLEVARGEYVYFMDSDDIASPTLLERSYDDCERFQLDFVSFDAEGFGDGDLLNAQADIVSREDLFVEGSSEVLAGTEYWRRFYSHHGVPYQPFTFFFRRTFLLENHLDFAEGIVYEDNDWTARVYMAARRMMCVPEKRYLRRYRRGSTLAAGMSTTAIKSFEVINRRLTTMLDAEQLDEKCFVAVDTLLLNVFYFSGCAADIATARVGLEEQAAFELSLTRLAHSTEDVGEVGCLGRVVLFHDVVAAFERCGDSEHARWAGGLAEPFLRASFPLGDEGSAVAVFGSGRCGRALLELWEKACGPIIAKAFIVDSFLETGGERFGLPVVNVGDLASRPHDSLVIAALKHRGEMGERVRATNE